jgi:serine/threonine protein kinase
MDKLEINTFETEEEKEVEKKEKMKDDLRHFIEFLLNNRSSFLGEGQTAKVHSHTENPDLCFKIIGTRSAAGKQLPKPTIPITTTASPGSLEGQFNSLEKEGDFLNIIQDMRGNVIIPKAYAWAMHIHEDEGATYTNREELSIMLMERIHGPSLRNILEDDAVIPETFEPTTFFDSLRNFLRDMHERGIFHRDLHDGNIMIDEKTGKPVIIDFGKSALGREEDVYEFIYTDRGRSIEGLYHKDEAYVNEIEIKINTLIKERQHELK